MSRCFTLASATADASRQARLTIATAHISGAESSLAITSGSVSDDAPSRRVSGQTSSTTESVGSDISRTHARKHVDLLRRTCIQWILPPQQSLEDCVGSKSPARHKSPAERMSTREWRALVDAAEEIREEMRSGRKQGGRLDPNVRGKIVERALDLKRSILHFVEEKLSRHTACCVLEDSEWTVQCGHVHAFPQFVWHVDRFLQATGPAAVLQQQLNEAQQDQAQGTRSGPNKRSWRRRERGPITKPNSRRPGPDASTRRPMPEASAAVAELERLQQEDSEANSIANARAVGVSREPVIMQGKAVSYPQRRKHGWRRTKQRPPAARSKQKARPH